MKVKEFVKKANFIDEYDLMDNENNEPIKRWIEPNNIPEEYKEYEIVEFYMQLEEDESIACHLYIKPAKE